MILLYKESDRGVQLDTSNCDNSEDVVLEDEEERRTFIVVHVRASDLVYEQHEDEAQHQRDADAGVELLVAVLVASGSNQRLVGVHLRLRRLHGAPMAVVVVFTCSGTQRRTLFTRRVRLYR